jgi:hypothetical protein
MASSSPSAANSPFTPLTSGEELRLWPLAVHAGHLLNRLRYVDYRQAEVAAALLARNLRDHYSDDEIERFSFVGLPRGGLIVLGMLAYQLDLLPEQLLAPEYSKVDRICLVDDCALSGLRLQQTLARMKKKRVAVALLYAAPGLRSAVQQQFPFVETCVSAHDLAEKPLDSPIEDRRIDSLLDGRLYGGPLETVAFAWNEPDLLVLTPFDSAPAHQWRFIPPHKCPKNILALGLPAAAADSQQWVVPDGIVYGWFDGVIYLLDTVRQEVFRLDGLAAGCWRAAAGYGSTDAALEFLSRRHADIDETDLRQTLESNLQQFEAHHLLRSLPT